MGWLGDGRVAKPEWRFPERRNHCILWTTATESTTLGWLSEGFADGINFSWKKTAAGCNLASIWANASSSLDGKGNLQPEDLTDSSRIPRLAYLNIFITKIYFKFWCLAPVASKAAWNDLKLLQQLQLFPDRDTSKATSHKLAGQLWYLSLVGRFGLVHRLWFWCACDNEAGHIESVNGERRWRVAETCWNTTVISAAKDTWWFCIKEKQIHVCDPRMDF